MKFYVYILESYKGRHYIGQTSNLEERLYKHNQKHKGFTGTEENWEIISSIEIPTRTEAIQLERKLKKLKNYRKALEMIEKLKSSDG